MQEELDLRDEPMEMRWRDGAWIKRDPALPILYGDECNPAPHYHWGPRHLGHLVHRCPVFWGNPLMELAWTK